jgi:hypothetical protein
MSVGFVIGIAHKRWVAFHALIAVTKKRGSPSFRKHESKTITPYPDRLLKGYLKDYHTYYYPSCVIHLRLLNQSLNHQSLRRILF